MKRSAWPLVFVAASVTCTDDDTTAEVTREVKTDAGVVKVTGTAFHRTWRGCSLAAAPHAGFFCLLPGKEESDLVTVKVAAPGREAVEIGLEELILPDEDQLAAAVDAMGIVANGQHLVANVEGAWHVYDYLPTGPPWLAEVSTAQPALATLPNPETRLIEHLGDPAFLTRADTDFWQVVKAQPTGGPLDAAVLGAWPSGDVIQGLVEARAKPGAGVSAAWRSEAEARALVVLEEPDRTAEALDVIVALEDAVPRLDERLLAAWPARDAALTMRLDRGPKPAATWTPRMATKAGGALGDPETAVPAARLILRLDDAGWRRAAIARLAAVAAAKPEAMGVLAPAGEELTAADCAGVTAGVVAWPFYDGTWSMMEAAVDGVCGEGMLPVVLDQWPNGDRAHEVLMRALKHPTAGMVTATQARLAAIPEGVEPDRVAAVRARLEKAAR